MNKRDVLDFPRLHSILKNNGVVGKKGGIPQVPFYVYLFYMSEKSLNITEYGKIEFDVNTLSSNQFAIQTQEMGATISRWCNGSRPINDDILYLVKADPKTAQDDYCEKLDRIFSEFNVIVGDDVYDSIKSLMYKDPLHSEISTPENNRKTISYNNQLAFAFVEALTNEYIKKKIKLSESIIAIDKDCRSKNVFTSFPYLMFPFIKKGDSLLIGAVKSLRPGYEESVKTAILDYCEKTIHKKEHPEWSVEESDVVFFAKKYALLEGRAVVGERELLKALFLLSDSSTLKKISSRVGGEQTLLDAIDKEYYAVTSTLPDL